LSQVLGTVVCAVVLSACSAAAGTTALPTSGQPGETPARPVTVPPGSGLATATTPGATPPTSPPASSATAPATPATTTPDSQSAAFSSPSGNIGCYVTAEGARCDILSSTFAVPPRPPSCSGAWGHGLSVSGSNPATYVCATDTTLGAPSVLSYGASARVGSFVCTSEPSGVSCQNVQTGHGFLLAKAIAHLF
jgi:hypothetical protein